MLSPIKSNFKTEWFSLCLIIISIISGFYFWQNFPARVASHWGINGQVDGYSGPLLAAFLVPLMMLAMYIVFIIVPYLDPKKDQYMTFAPIYHKFKDLMISFLFILYFLTGLNGLGFPIDVALYVPVMVGALFIIIGRLLKNVKMNWFMGIRTPWTMSSEKVWDKTHELSSRIFVISGLLMAATILVTTKLKIVFFVLAMALIIFALPIYSYVLFIKEKKENNSK
ncbi:MAG: SdpI family protein [Candidatus Falkowbacteria bacterium]